MRSYPNAWASGYLKARHVTSRLDKSTTLRAGLCRGKSKLDLFVLDRRSPMASLEIDIKPDAVWIVIPAWNESTRFLKF